MFSRQILFPVIFIGFMILVGFCLAKAFYHGSIIGIILGFTSLGAGINFLYILARARKDLVENQSAGKMEEII